MSWTTFGSSDTCLFSKHTLRHVSNASKQATAQYCCHSFGWQEEGRKRVQQLKLATHGVSPKKHWQLWSSCPYAPLYPRGKCRIFVKIRNIFTSQPTLQSRKTVFYLYSRRVSIYCPRVTRKALGTGGWRQCQVCTADRAAGLDASFSSPSRPTVLGRHSLQCKYSSCPHFQMRLG